MMATSLQSILSIGLLVTLPCGVLAMDTPGSGSTGTSIRPLPIERNEANQDKATVESEPDVITVWGSRARQIGKAQSASEGSVDFGRFVDRPLLRVGELAEVVPGLAATQHSGTGKANQYFLRGFNLDHGTDFSISLDGMPLNLRTNAHGQGYLDINFLIPEIIGRIDYKKGVANVEAGDFSAAGSARFLTFETLPHSFAQIELGANSWARAVLTSQLGQVGYLALDATQDDGPWDRPENLKKISGFMRLNRGSWSLTGGLFDAQWDASDQIPLRAVRSGALSPLGNVNDTVGGKTKRGFVNLSFQNEALTANFYAMGYRLNLYSDFTYFLDDPANGDQFQQREQRTQFGGRVQKVFQPLGPWTPVVGLEARLDRIDPIILCKTTNRLCRDIVREDRVEQDSAGLFGKLNGQFGRARVELGLRADEMAVDVKSDDPRNSGTSNETIVSPKASIAWQFSEGLEAYASAGNGFHSNDARGAVIAFDPASGEPVSPVPLYVKASGLEAGLRFERRDINATASIFSVDLDSELVYVGDAGTTEPSNASRRTGIELTLTRAIGRWLTLDGAAALTRARFRGADTGQDRIPLATEYVLTGGATLRLGPNITSVITLRHLGPAPLIEDNSERSKTSTVANGRIAYRRGHWVIAAEALNIFDSGDADITYFYGSRLPGEPSDGIEDVHLHPIPPRSFRLQVRKEF